MKPVLLLLILWTTTLRGEEAKPATAGRLGFTYEPAKNQEEPAASTASPASDVVVMPAFTVKDPRIKLTEEDVLGPSEKLARAKDETLSPLYQNTFGPLSQLAAYYFDFTAILGGWHPNAAEAMVLHAQNVRLRKMREFDDTVALVKLVDPKQAAELMRMRPVIFRRKEESDHTPMSVIQQQRNQPKSHP